MTTHDATAPKERTRSTLYCRLKGLLFAGFITLALFSQAALFAQTGGGGAIEGTILDATGAVVPDATVTATNVNTGVVTTRPSTSAGFYSIAPLAPGQYTVTVTANGFQTFKQENFVIDALHVSGLNVHLKNGAATETVTVTDAPPALETTNATLGGTVPNSVYTALPIMIAGSQQRDITQFSNLLPGAQVPPGGRSSIIGGTAQRLGELYLDGLPLTTVSQQGDNRPVFNIVPLEAIDAIQVVTSGFSAEYQGAGLENYSTKAGTNKYHGSIFAFVRNTAFDAWSFSSKPGGGNTIKAVQNGVLVTLPGPKPAEHQIELGYTIGGPITIPKLFNGHDKLFFFSTYDKFHSSIGVNPSSSTVPTTLMRQGNFCELLSSAAGGCGPSTAPGYVIYDPATLACPTATTCTRSKYPNNIIPASQLSPITQYLQKFLPPPTIDTAGVIQNNYIGGIPSGYDNWLYSGRIDYEISGKNHLNFILTGGNRHAIPYTATTTNFPVPYLVSTLSIVAGHWAAMEDTYTINSHLVNQFKYGFMNFGGPPIRNPTNGIAQYEITAAGVTGLPAGQASENFPGVTFGGSNAQNTWATPSTGSTSVSETYEIVDNVQWTKGAHALTFGFQYQWLENQASTADTNSLPITLAFSPNETGNISGTNYVSNSGYAYASFLLGAVSTSSVTQQPFSVLGGRFRPFAPYVQDDWKVTPKLTLNLGLRWDYIPSYTEVLDRWSFLNPNIVNPVTGNLGALQFAGNKGGAGISCNCRTPVNNYFKNFGPRFGLAYSLNDKTVIRGGYALMYTHGGGVGGAGGAATGSGQDGFTSRAPFAEGPAGPQAGPAFYLNNNPAFSAPNANFGGKGFVLAAPAAISAISQTLDTGYYICSGQQNVACSGQTGVSAGNGTTISAPDPYLSGRAPELAFYNFGFQRVLTKDYTLTVNYVGTQTHFLVGAGNIRGLQSGQLNPAYFPVGMVNCGVAPAFSSCLTAPATAANLAKVQAAGITLAVPYAGYTAVASGTGAALNSSATIAHMLTWMPQYAGTTDTWPAAANANYNSLQISLAKSMSHGLTFNVNYTYSKNIDDAGTIRSGWPIPASATSNGKAWAADRIDRALSINDLPELLTIYGVYQLPFGKGKIGSDHFAVRAIAGGWQLSEIFQYASGLPLALTANCNALQNPGQGTCMPDFNPNFAGSARTTDKWGAGATALNLGQKSYINGYLNTANPINAANVLGLGVGGQPCASTTGPFCNSNNFAIGNLSRIAPYGLRGPDTYRLTASISRTFDLSDRFKFIFRVDCQNVTNHTTFGNNSQNNQITTNVNSATFGTLNFASGDPRAFQLSGRINF